MEADDQEDPGFFRRHRVLLIIGALAILGGIAYFAFGAKSETKKKPRSNVVSIMPVLPPPPPPPTPAPTPPPQEAPPPDNPKQPEFQSEEKPESAKEAPKPEAPDDAPAPLGTNLQGNGPDGFGLTGRGGGGMIGGTGKGGGGGSKYGWYAGQVQSRIVDALQKHRRTRSAALSIKVRIWADASGRVTRAKLEGSSGDSAVDQALVSEILTGLQLQEPPPEDMPMPIVMRITAKRPN